MDIWGWVCSRTCVCDLPVDQDEVAKVSRQLYQAEPGRSRLTGIWSRSYSAAYQNSEKYLTFFGAICAVHLVLCMVFAVMTSKRFGRGLQKSLQEGRRAIYDEEDPTEIEARKRRNMNLDL